MSWVSLMLHSMAPQYVKPVHLFIGFSGTIINLFALFFWECLSCWVYLFWICSEKEFCIMLYFVHISYKNYQQRWQKFGHIFKIESILNFKVIILKISASKLFRVPLFLYCKKKINVRKIKLTSKSKIWLDNLLRGMLYSALNLKYKSKTTGVRGPLDYIKQLERLR